MNDLCFSGLLGYPLVYSPINTVCHLNKSGLTSLNEKHRFQLPSTPS